jgi:hypothetical protein
MYLAAVVSMMFALPLVSIIAEALWGTTHVDLLILVGKWFVFWAMGIRLFTAGLRQAIRPELTAEGILGIKGKESLIVVQELGFANIGMGALGVLSITRAGWVFPAAIAGLLFYGLAGIRHVFVRRKNRLEVVAMVSDLFIFVVLSAYVIAELLTRLV